MRLVSLASLVALAASTIDVAAAPLTSNPTLPPSLTTRQTLFAIPFQIDRAEDPMREPVEVQLYVSTDQGTNWQLFRRVRPEQGKFLFRAVTDAEYWFATRTVDRSGVLRPERVDGPGLRVVVDTTLPELRLEARQGEGGQVVLGWQVTEAHLDAESLTIQHRSDASQPWQSVAIDRQSVRSSGTTCWGEVMWWPPSRSQAEEIRAEVSDTAGNTAVSHAQVSLAQVASTDPRLSAELAGARPDLSHAPLAPAAPWHASSDSLPQAPQRYAPRPTPPAYPPTDPALARHPQQQSPASSALGWREDVGQNLTPGAADRPLAWPPEGSVAVDANPALGKQYVTSPATGDVTRQSALPPEVRPQMVNSRLFELEYQIDARGPSGIGRVELWGTRDGGCTWTSFGVDRDTRSPMLVTVNEEGVYGFRVAMTDAHGLGGEKPRRGAPPDVWIGVDLTEPSAQILSVERGAGRQAGQLIIQWEADDAMLSPRPVSLFYSEMPGGPWAEIGSELENTGRYRWSPGHRLPQRIYLRLEIRDEAGNVGVSETTDTTALSALQPVGHIRKVRPVVDSARAPAARYR